ncbi:MAG: hypothetical protein ACXVPQ_10950 [Bacteroidia bacterium]
MKTNFKQVLFIFVLGLAISSCSKTYNCHCMYKENGVTTHEDDTKISETSKDKATSSCNQRNSSTSSTLGGNTYVNTTECAIN